MSGRFCLFTFWLSSLLSLCFSSLFHLLLGTWWFFFRPWLLFRLLLRLLLFAFWNLPSFVLVLGIGLFDFFDCPFKFVIRIRVSLQHSIGVLIAPLNLNPLLFLLLNFSSLLVSPSALLLFFNSNLFLSLAFFLLNSCFLLAI